MSAALGLLLIAQLNSFEFVDIPSPQYAGDSFSISIVAKDANGVTYPYSGSALLKTSKDAFYSYVYPNLITFSGGIWQGYVTVTLAESLHLICIEPANLITGRSNDFEVDPGFPDHYLILLPGEELSPGSPDGRLPNPPLNQRALDTFDFDVYLVDVWHNVVRGSDSVYFSATDSFARMPQPAEIMNGQGTYRTVFRQAARHRLHARPGGGSPVKPDTSSQFTVTAADFGQLLLLLPGETPLPGDDATEEWQTPGKTGEPEPQFLGAQFPVTIYACDPAWNRTPASGEELELHSSFPILPEPEYTHLDSSGLATSMVAFQSSGQNQNIWVTDRQERYESYVSWIDILSLPSVLEVSAPDTIRGGETAHVYVTLRDVAGDSVVLAPIWFAVTAGHGRFLDDEGRQNSTLQLRSDFQGMARARFLCTPENGAEHDTIRITADTVSFVYHDIFIDISDRVLLDGEVVAHPNPFGFNEDRVAIDYWLRYSTPLTVKIYDPFGNLVWSRAINQNTRGAKSGYNRIYWDGRNQVGRRVANGIYVVQILGVMHTGTTFKGECRIGVLW
jgi:hypothetical protein